MARNASSATGDTTSGSTYSELTSAIYTAGTTGDDQSTLSPNSTFPALIIPTCEKILYYDIGSSRVRVWDLCILIPNFLFLVFLVCRARIAIAKLRNTNSPIFTAFYCLVCLAAIISVLRCVVSMTVNAALPAGDIADKLLWLVLRFFLLATEMSVIIFGLAFGHLDSRTSIQLVLGVTSFIALVYSITQGVLEFVYPHKFGVPSGSYDLFGHGGMMFWFITSLIFFVVYLIIVLLPFTKLKDRLALPSKTSFYMYAGFLAVLDFVQSIGSGLLYYEHYNGMCVVDVTTYIYFTFFAPMVYGTFLKDFFAVAQPSILFSYKAQLDEPQDEDVVNMPYQTAYPKPTEEVMASDIFDSTHFDHQNSLMGNNSINSVPPIISINGDPYTVDT